MSDVLEGKAILIVDDESDVLESLRDLLDMCIVDSAPDFETAKRFLKTKSYDGAILDIMGVNGYELLELTNKIGIPALMLTAHALSSENLVKSLKNGAYAYLPKHEMADISDFLTEMIEAKEKGQQKPKRWFEKLSPYFDENFGPDWKDNNREILQDLNLAPSREELSKIL